MLDFDLLDLIWWLLEKVVIELIKLLIKRLFDRKPK